MEKELEDLIARYPEAYRRAATVASDIEESCGPLRLLPTGIGKTTHIGGFFHSRATEIVFRELISGK